MPVLHLLWTNLTDDLLEENDENPERLPDLTYERECI